MEAIVEIMDRKEKEITEKEEDLTQDPKEINLEEEGEDKVHQRIIDLRVDQMEVEVTQETETAPEVKAETEEVPEVEAKTGAAPTEVEATLLIEEDLHQKEEEEANHKEEVIDIVIQEDQTDKDLTQEGEQADQTQ